MDTTSTSTSIQIQSTSDQNTMDQTASNDDLEISPIHSDHDTLSKYRNSSFVSITTQDISNDKDDDVTPNENEAESPQFLSYFTSNDQTK